MKGSEPTRKICRVPSTAAKMALPLMSVMAHTEAGGSPAPIPAPDLEPALLYLSAMDTYVPIIPNPKPDNIERRFKHPTLTKIEDEPDYKQMCTSRKKLFCNAIDTKSTFWGRKHGHLGSVQQPAVY